MRLITIALTATLLACSLWAQEPATPPPAPPPPGADGPKSHHDMVNPDMVAMRQHQAHAEEMKAEVAKMQAKVELMKASVAKMEASAAKDQAQLDVDLWDGVVQHMEGMVKMIADHGAMGMGPMEMMHGHEGMHEGMSCCAGMKKGDEAGCCGGNKCMKDDKPGASAEKP